MLIAAVLVLLAGAAIGATAIGGVLVVPALAGVAGVPIGEAIAASSFGFLLTGLLGWRRGGSAPSEALARMWPLHAAALAGAAGGALLVHAVSPGCGAAVGGGARARLGHSCAGRRRGAPSRRCANLRAAAALAALGVAVGCGSALSGTGGPVLLLPVFMLLGLPIVSVGRHRAGDPAADSDGRQCRALVGRPTRRRPRPCGGDSRWWWARGPAWRSRGAPTRCPCAAAPRSAWSAPGCGTD